MIIKKFKQKNMVWYLIISFGLGWLLFVLPLASGPAGSSTRQTVSLITWSIAMWAPGLAAIVCTRRVDRKPFASLNLQRLGNWRVYLWAWLTPFFLTIAAGLLTWLLGVGKLDLEFSSIQKAMEAATGPRIPPAMIVLLQIAMALTIGPIFNTLFALGEELGWRGYLLPQLEGLGQWKAIVLSGVIWGLWHMPVILQGHNYPQHPVAGVFLMIVFCVLFGAFLSWLYLQTRSPWAPALGHGSLNAVAGLPILFMPTVDLAFGGPISSIVGWIPMVVFLAWLVWRGKLPVKDSPGETNASMPEDQAALSI